MYVPACIWFRCILSYNGKPISTVGASLPQEAKKGTGGFIVLFHCVKFKQLDIWYLEPNELFENRKLYIGVCPVCKKPIAELVQYRKTDNTKFTTSYSEHKYINIIKKEKYNTLYRYAEQRVKKSLYQWIFGETRKTKDGIKHFACDFFGVKRKLST